MNTITCPQSHTTHKGIGNQTDWPTLSPDLDALEFSFPWCYAKDRVCSDDDECGGDLRNRIRVTIYRVTPEVRRNNAEGYENITHNS